jgi:hydroxyethylthiazole kinase-like uncharacterized protein yjeF
MPIPILSIAQMRQWERSTWKTGQTEEEIIRQVGRKLADCALELTAAGDRILIIAGKGHNGDDARQARRHLADRQVDLLEVNDPAADFNRLEELLSLRPRWIIDGLFGIGLNRPLTRPWVRIINRINAAGANVLAVDVPSGLNADTGEPQPSAIEAAVTLTVGAPKKGLLEAAAWRYVGRLEIAREIGLRGPIPASPSLWIVPKDFDGFPPRRPVAGHKGTFGHAAIIAGSQGYHGAAVLAARGAQRARPGLVTVFPQTAVYVPVAAQAQAVMVQPWLAQLKWPGTFSAILAGPGLAGEVPEELKVTIRELWTKASVPMVVDASALVWLPKGAVRTKAARVITPHPGEAGRLLNKTAEQIQANRPAIVRALSRKYGACIVVLKGHQTLIGQSVGESFVNSSGNPGLAQGGAGDVLGGYIAGLLAQRALQADAIKTVRYAVWQHGAAADLLERRRANWVIEDLIEALGAC